MSKIIALEPYLTAALLSAPKPTFTGYPRFAKEFNRPTLASLAPHFKPFAVIANDATIQ